MAYVSVIIPCYNVESYIDRCLETVVHQTIGIENLEIILVNDASTDNTLDKLKLWESRYPDSIIVVTYDENLRQGGAINVGMQYATSEYFGIVGADDWIELSMYEKLYTYAKEGSYDMVSGKFIRERSVGEHTVDNSRRRDVAYHFEKRQDFYLWDVSDVGDTGEFGSLACAIFLKFRVLDNDLWFPEHVAYEDNYWASLWHLYARSLYIMDEIVYHYFINLHSTTTTKNSPHQLDRLAIEVAVMEAYKQRGAFELYYRELERDFIQRFYLNTLFILFTRFDELPDIFDYMKEKVLEYFPDYKNSPYFSQFTSLNQTLLELLDIQGLTTEDLYKIRAAYMKMF